MIYDSTDYHSDSAYDAGFQPDCGGTHIGMFLAWMIIHNLEGEMHKKHSSAGLAAVRKREMTGRDFLFEYCDGKLTDEDLNDQGNIFASFYYLNSGDKTRPCYYDDWAEIALDIESIYGVRNDWENYALISDYITTAYQKLPKDPSKLRRLTKNLAFTGIFQQLSAPMLERGFKYVKSKNAFYRKETNRICGFHIWLSSSESGYSVDPLVLISFPEIQKFYSAIGISDDHAAHYAELSSPLEMVHDDHYTTWRPKVSDEESLQAATKITLEGFDLRAKEFFATLDSLESVERILSPVHSAPNETKLQAHLRLYKSNSMFYLGAALSLKKPITDDLKKRFKHIFDNKHLKHLHSNLEKLASAYGVQF